MMQNQKIEKNIAGSKGKKEYSMNKMQEAKSYQ
jgi:hypothetical protein